MCVCLKAVFTHAIGHLRAFINQPVSSCQRVVEAAEEAHHQHEENPDLQVRRKNREEKKEKRGQII